LVNLPVQVCFVTLKVVVEYGESPAQDTAPGNPQGIKEEPSQQEIESITYLVINLVTRDGTIDDWAYGAQRIFMWTFEMGTNTFYPTRRAARM
jgi:hypothetical protein